MKKVAILQSNYIPWKGYFDLINSVDVFVLYDDVQYTRRDWRNRNKIKTKHGTKWLTVPVKSKGNFHAKIKDIEVSNNTWPQEHLNSLCHEYSNTRYFYRYSKMIENLYASAKELSHLSSINELFIRCICESLGINTDIRHSSEFELEEGKSERLMHICRGLEASIYVSGPAAKAYLDEDLFRENNLQVEWYQYGKYPEYAQKYLPFEHSVTILDLLLNTGPEAKKYMNSFDS